MTTEETMAGEPTIVWGAEAIARVLHVDRRRAFYLLETGQVPARKVGGKWVASAEKLRAALLGEGA